jgi:hypothetical protein
MRQPGRLLAACLLFVALAFAGLWSDPAARCGITGGHWNDGIALWAVTVGQGAPAGYQPLGPRRDVNLLWQPYCSR